MANKVKGTEKRKRSILKAVTWRVIASLVTVFLVLVFSGNINLALSVGILETTFKMVFYYFHERAWGMVSWGIIPYV